MWTMPSIFVNLASQSFHHSLFPAEIGSVCHTERLLFGSSSAQAARLNPALPRHAIQPISMPHILTRLMASAGMVVPLWAFTLSRHINHRTCSCFVYTSFKVKTDYSLGALLTLHPLQIVPGFKGLTHSWTWKAGLQSRKACQGHVPVSSITSP